MVRRFPSLPCNKRPESSCSCCCKPAEAQLTFFRFSLWFHATPKRTDALGSARAISTNRSAIFFCPPPNRWLIRAVRNRSDTEQTLCQWHTMWSNSMGTVALLLHVSRGGQQLCLYGYRHSRCWGATLCSWDRKPSDKIIRLSFQITDSTSLAVLEDVKPLCFFFTTHHVFHIMQRAKE